MEKEKVIMYSDGGCRNNQEKNNIGAWAYTVTYKDSRLQNSKAVKNTTNNIMELTAVIEGLIAIKAKDLPVEVYTDSTYVEKGMNEWIKKWKPRGMKKADGKPVENQSLWLQLDYLVNQFSIRPIFIHVKAHANNGRNEEVDKMCNVAMDNFANKEIDNPILIVQEVNIDDIDDMESSNLMLINKQNIVELSTQESDNVIEVEVITNDGIQKFAEKILPSIEEALSDSSIGKLEEVTNEIKNKK